MMRLFEKKYFRDCLPELIQTILLDGMINSVQVKTIIDSKGLIDGQSSVSMNRDDLEALNNVIQFCITAIALDRGFSFKVSQELALISGAGIAGLAASFELLARGFKVIITEKRNAFDRFNVINLDVESQRFLKKFALLDEFEKNIAGRIKTHKYVLSEEKGMKNLGSSDVSKLQSSKVPFEPEFFNELFNLDGIYSVRIKDLQTFLAKKALDAGVHLFGDTETEILIRTSAGVSEVQLAGKKLQPHLFFVAEGVYSNTAKQLGMEITEVKNECTDENWIFGNAKYSGNETFVVSMIDISTENLQIANIIFNATIHEINIAVSCEKYLNQEQIQERILKVLKQVFLFLNLDESPQSLIASVKQPVHANNEKRVIYSQDNVFCVGDTAGHSSPLAGMGGTLGLTLVPRVIEQLVNDSERQPHKMHDNFDKFTEAYTSRWIMKSQTVKKHCLSLFKNKECTSSVHHEQPSAKKSEQRRSVCK